MSHHGLLAAAVQIRALEPKRQNVASVHDTETTSSYQLPGFEKTGSAVLHSGASISASNGQDRKNDLGEFLRRKGDQPLPHRLSTHPGCAYLHCEVWKFETEMCWLFWHGMQAEVQQPIADVMSMDQWAAEKKPPWLSRGSISAWRAFSRRNSMSPRGQDPMLAFGL
ncbi:uncharacterized protein PG998_000991 [Apiospora kogelbergensis]|uniref:Uncharacterized protein n=1 Tax=Apiospora kogelbergensis TaxID=1337665 RepID=A0AAW0QVW6_9PEZI